MLTKLPMAQCSPFVIRRALVWMTANGLIRVPLPILIWGRELHDGLRAHATTEPGGIVQRRYWTRRQAAPRAAQDPVGQWRAPRLWITESHDAANSALASIDSASRGGLATACVPDSRLESSKRGEGSMSSAIANDSAANGFG
jgi:hypothetical protein